MSKVKTDNQTPSKHGLSQTETVLPSSGIALGNRQEQGEAFWQRMQALIGNEDPYAFAARIGLNKSTFQSARERKSKPRATTLMEWSERLGCNPAWLIRGEGEMWLPEVNSQVQMMVSGYQEQAQGKQLQQISSMHDKTLQVELLEKAILTLEEALKTTRRQLSSSNKARLIVSIYALYAGVPDPALVRDTVTELIRSAA